jgi:hypothetical protein
VAAATIPLLPKASLSRSTPASQTDELKRLNPAARQITQTEKTDLMRGIYAAPWLLCTGFGKGRLRLVYGWLQQKGQGMPGQIAAAKIIVPWFEKLIKIRK